jgi:4'-phosphopantetheinyl transferase EntD
LTTEVSDGAIGTMSAKEARAVALAADKRKREFATARLLAREGLERFFDVRGFDLINDAERAPIWPEGISGSISHSNVRAWVALVDGAFGTIGIDGEHRDELERDLWHMTMLDREVAFLETLDESIRGRRALALFSAKEALYKAQYPRSGEYMGFMALRVELDEDGALRCIFQQDVGPFPEGFVAHGRWTDAGEIVSAVWIPREW